MYWLASWGLLPWHLSAQLPADFNRQLVVSDFENAVGLVFDEEGHLYVWEKAGRVWAIEAGRRLEPPLLDLTEETGNWRDHGLLGMALHPNFRQNGYIYLLYAVDRHYLMHYGSSSYEAGTSESFAATIGRVTRYTADPATNFSTLVPDSRHILIGETPQTGIPLLHESHGVGTLLFGTDGSLLVSCGDGASYNGVDVGGLDSDGYGQQALQDGIIRPAEDVGAFRAQLIDSHNGKILRIDPATGDGLPSNPFFDKGAPRAPRSRVWALGFRNPFRMTLMPGTGSHNAAAGDPGILYVGDSGSWAWEELDIVRAGGQNFGWPIFEGTDLMWPFFSRTTSNLDLPNPRYQPGNCDISHFRFRDLIQQVHQSGAYSYPDPCDPAAQLPDEIPRFVHEPPALAWNNEQNSNFGAYAFDFDSTGAATTRELTDPRSPISGPSFSGTSAIAGTFYTGDRFPPDYRGAYFQADYGGWWLRAVRPDSTGTPLAIANFDQGVHRVVGAATSPLDGCLYYVHYGSSVWKICYGGNVPPVAQLDADTSYGPSPLTVRFSAANSFDDNGDSLEYHWDFGDGHSSQEIAPAHTFSARTTAPTSYTVTLTVSDSASTGQAQQLISLNNTPPLVQIVGAEPGATYSVFEPEVLTLRAQVTDAEHTPDQMTYAWQAFLHHNTHNHPEAITHEPEAAVRLTPAGCGGELYYYRITLAVTDPAGLRGEDELILFPECDHAVRWGTITAAQVGPQVGLSFSVDSVEGVDFFEIERSTDRLTYTRIGNLRAKGAGRYSFADASPTPGTLAYRVRALRHDGKTELSSLAEATYLAYGEISLYPNPVRDDWHITFNHIEGGATLRLYDLSGRELYYQSLPAEATGSHTFSLASLRPGIYLYQVENGILRKQGLLTMIQD